MSTIVLGTDGKKRCFGGEIGKELYGNYHDNEWGVPVYDDRLLFEMLVLEGAQAGLRWEIILKKRAEYRMAFYNFDVQKVAAMSNNELETLCNNPGIIRNRLKIYSARTNAAVFIDIQNKFQSFANYLWNFVNNKPIIGHWHSYDEIPVTSPISVALSQDLKKRGMTFVGTIIMYAYMQAVGVVNDHLYGCWCYTNSNFHQ